MSISGCLVSRRAERQARCAQSVGFGSRTYMWLVRAMDFASEGQHNGGRLVRWLVADGSRGGMTTSASLITFTMTRCPTSRVLLLLFSALQNSELSLAIFTHHTSCNLDG